MNAQPDQKIDPHDGEPHRAPSQVTQRITEWSPRLKARIAGVFELLEGLTSPFGQVVVLSRLIVAGNAATTATNILSHEQLFWLGFASSPLKAQARLLQKHDWHPLALLHYYSVQRYATLPSTKDSSFFVSICANVDNKV